VHERDALAEPGEERGLLDRGVAAATTMISWSRKKNPSQVAHQETPRPDIRFSSSRPSSRYADPVARMTERAWNVSPPSVWIVFTSPSRSSTEASSHSTSAPNFSACFCRPSISSGPWTPSGKPGKFSTSVVFIRAPPAVTDPAITRGASPARAA